MKRTTVTATLRLFAVFGLLTLGIGAGTGSPSVCHAMAQLTKVYVVSEVKAENRRVTLLDLCDASGIPEDWRKLMSEIDIGESPAPGTEKVIQPLQLKAFMENFIKSQDYDPSRVKIVLPERISVRRVTMLIPRDQIEEIFKDYLQSMVASSKEDLVVSGVNYAGTVELPRGNMTWEATTNARAPYLGNVAISIQFFINGEKETSLNVTGRVGVYRNVVLATRALKRNGIVSEEDVEIRKLLLTDHPDRYPLGLDQAIGRRVLRGIQARQPLTASDLEDPAAIKRGAPVTIIYEKSGLKLTAKGQVREDAAVGSTIRVINVMTNRPVVCRVVDSTTVQVIP